MVEDSRVDDPVADHVADHVNPLVALAVVVPAILIYAGIGYAVYVIARAIL